MWYVFPFAIYAIYEMFIAMNMCSVLRKMLPGRIANFNDLILVSTRKAMTFWAYSGLEPVCKPLLINVLPCFWKVLTPLPQCWWDPILHSSISNLFIHLRHIYSVSAIYRDYNARYYGYGNEENIQECPGSYILLREVEDKQTINQPDASVTSSMKKIKQ